MVALLLKGIWRRS